MRKFALISLALLLFATPAMANQCYGDKVAHNVERLGDGIERITESNTNIQNFQVKISLAEKVGQLREVIESGRAMKDSRLVKEDSFHRVYVSMLSSFEDGLDDMMTGIRHENAEAFQEAQNHFETGMKKMVKIRNALQGSGS